LDAKERWQLMPSIITGGCILNVCWQVLAQLVKNKSYRRQSTGGSTATVLAQPILSY